MKEVATLSWKLGLPTANEERELFGVNLRTESLIYLL